MSLQRLSSIEPSAWRGEFIEFQPGKSGSIAHIGTTTRKTHVWFVLSQAGGVLGGVRWYAPWRKYCFFAAPDCIFEQVCLREIAEFIEGRTNDRTRNS